MSPSPDTGSRAELRRQQRQALIVAAAEDELAESGLAGTTLDRVGDRVGLSKGALYYYVSGRDQLLALVLADGLRAIRADADRRAGPDAAPLARLEAFARAHVHAAVERPAGQLIVANVDVLASQPDTAQLLRGHEGAARALLQQAIDGGQVRPVDPVVAGTVLFGALNTIPRAYNPDGPRSLDDIIDTALDLTLHSWAAVDAGEIDQ